jgi:hypothetical protein
MKYAITVLISYTISITHVCGANDRVYDTSLYEDSTFQLSLLRLEYQYFMAQNEEEQYESLWQKINLNFSHQNYKNAIQEIDRIISIDNQILHKNLYFIKIEELLFQHELYNTCLDMMQIDSIASQTVEQSFLKTLCLNEEGQLELIKIELRRAAIAYHKDTSTIFKELKNFEIKSTLKQSVFFQSVFPGAGMLHEGELKEGLTSFLMNGIFAATPVVLGNHKLYITAFSYGIMPFSKFYFGGIKHTKYLAEKNEEKRLALLKKQNAAILFQFYK